MRKIAPRLIAALGLALCMPAFSHAQEAEVGENPAATPPPAGTKPSWCPTPFFPGETKAQRDARMAWWRDAKFGLFIHWGLYAIQGGNLNGKNYNTEWMYAHARIPVAEYKKNAAIFNPVAFDAEAWVRLAKEAGQKYIVITTKHHDGFAMYPTKVSKFNIRDATSFKRDPIAELAEACRKEGIKLGFYYSQGQDWTNPGGGFVTSAKGPWDEEQKGDFNTYVDTVALPQVKELLTNYGPDIPALMWFDTPTGNMNMTQVDKFLTVLRTRPNLIMNNRLKYGGPGDYSTPERYIPPTGFEDTDWECAMTMNEHWGYGALDRKWKSAATLIRQLIDSVSKGGNYLLNVGPMADGTIQPECVERLKQMGAWMKVNGEAIYGTKPTIFGAEGGSVEPGKGKDGKPKFVVKWDWRCTTKPGKIYIHLFKWPSGSFELAGVKGKVTGATLLADPGHSALKVTQTGSQVSVALPAKAPDPIASVLRLDVVK